MDTYQFHIEQYKMLREEIMHHMRESDRTAFWGIPAAGAVYAWLILHNDVSSLPTAAWFISPFVILFCSFRVLMITLRMMHVAKYLRHIELAVFGEGAKLPGWECHLYKNVGHLNVLSPAVTAIVFWLLLIFGSFLGSCWLLSHVGHSYNNVVSILGENCGIPK